MADTRKEAGAGPLHRYRSHTCGELRKGNVGATARLSGWVHRVRDHGGLLFIDLRDHYGVTQCVLTPSSPAFATAESARFESVISVEGKVIGRTAENINPNLPTGRVEVSSITGAVARREGGRDRPHLRTFETSPGFQAWDHYYHL